MTKFKLAMGLILSLLITLPSGVWAFGQMTQPINIANAMRGQQISQEIIIVNSDAKQISASFEAEGQIKDWVKFYQPGDLKTAISTTTIPAKSNLNLIAIISVPKDAANGEYKGVISATNIPDKQVGVNTSASVSQKIDRQVTIKITDKENLKLAVSVIPETYDVGMGQPLKVRIIYDNQSNVSLSPSISFKIKSGDQTIYNVIYPYPDGEAAVNSLGQHEIPALTIPTTGLGRGKYQAQLQFMKGDQVLVEKQFGFSVGTAGNALTTQIMDIIRGNWLLWIILLLIAVIVIVGRQMKTKKHGGQISEAPVQQTRMEDLKTEEHKIH